MNCGPLSEMMRGLASGCSLRDVDVPVLVGRAQLLPRSDARSPCGGGLVEREASDAAVANLMTERHRWRGPLGVERSREGGRATASPDVRRAVIDPVSTITYSGRAVTVVVTEAAAALHDAPRRARRLPGTSLGRAGH
jgi:hypothetical protein